MTLIDTPRLRLKPSAMDMDSIRKMVSWLNDPIVTRYSEQRHKIHSVETQLAYIKSFGPPNIFYEIFYMRKLIGTLTAYIDEPNGIADVGIMIGDRNSWGLGLGFEAWEAVCNSLLARDIRKIEAGCMSTNSEMIKVARKYEMFPDGMRADHFRLSDGETADLYQWGKFSNESNRRE